MLKHGLMLLALGLGLGSDAVAPAHVDFDIACYDKDRDAPPVRQALARVCKPNDRMHLFVQTAGPYRYAALVAITSAGQAVWLTDESEQARARVLGPSNYFSLDVDFVDQPYYGEAQVHAVFAPYPLDRQAVQDAVSSRGHFGLAHVAQTIWWVEEPS